MQNIEDFNIKSELLKEHWETVCLVYISLKESVKNYKLEIDSDEFDSEILFFMLYDILLKEWEKIYPKFVLSPIKEKIIEIFIEAQTIDFKLKKPYTFKRKAYIVHYYILQYFSIGVVPYHEHEYFPDIGLKTSNSGNLNLLLYKIFDKLWCELKLDIETKGDLFDDGSEFYDLEVNLLSDFLSKCWNEAKSKVNIDVVGILVESTAVGATYNLDDNKELKDGDSHPIFD